MSCCEGNLLPRGVPRARCWEYAGNGIQFECTSVLRTAAIQNVSHTHNIYMDWLFS